MVIVMVLFGFTEHLMLDPGSEEQQYHLQSWVGKEQRTFMLNFSYQC